MNGKTAGREALLFLPICHQNVLDFSALNLYNQIKVEQSGAKCIENPRNGGEHVDR